MDDGEGASISTTDRNHSHIFGPLIPMDLTIVLRAHNPKVGSSNPPPAIFNHSLLAGGFFSAIKGSQGSKARFETQSNAAKHRKIRSFWADFGQTFGKKQTFRRLFLRKSGCKIIGLFGSGSGRVVGRLYVLKKGSL